MEAKTTNPTTIPAKCETLSYDGYTLQWEDDFNGPELNREDWNVELHEAGWVNHELQAYIDSPQTIYIQNRWKRKIQTGRCRISPGGSTPSTSTISCTAFLRHGSRCRQAGGFCLLSG